MTRVRRLQLYCFSARFFWVSFLLVFLFSSIAFFSFSVFAQDIAPVPESPSPALEPAPAVQPVPETPVSESPTPAPISSAPVSETQIPQPVSESVAPAPITPEPSPKQTPEPPVSSPTSTESSLTLLDTGDIIIPTLEWIVTPEANDILSLFSSSDFLIEIEVIFSELNTDIKTEIQSDPTLADNTDEDPNVDLVDPSIISDPVEPTPEPGSDLEVDIQDDPSVVESQGETQSSLWILELLFNSEELLVRRFEKDITLDPSASHTCRADIFRADLQATDFSRARVTLAQNRKKNVLSFLEIGSLPTGIDVVFKSNEEYAYTPGSREAVIEFSITRQTGADIGDFTIPIIYTLQEGRGSSVVCQINILNN